MKSRILHIISVYALLVAIFVLLKGAFMLVVGGYAPGDFLPVAAHGLAMDLSMAGYFSAIPLLIAIAGIWISHRWLGIAIKAYFALIALVIALIAVADAALYPYWGFRIDTTPLFYFLTSPASAMASVEWWQWIVAPLAIAAITWFVYKVLTLCWFAKPFRVMGRKRRGLQTAVMTLLGALLFIAIRGGVTVSTMNPGRSYFSPQMRLNHAAVNPVFSLLYSAAHQGKLADRFRFMPDEQAQAVMDQLYASSDSSLVTLGYLPDVQLIILESFSSHLLPSMGGEPIALRLDSIASDGWLFSDFYASSFRTDRALPAILCAYPAQPTTSLLKYTTKLDALPSLPRALKDAGYETSYYYGGDINFTNVNAMLVAAGFDRIVSDTDFPVGQRLSKWGVHDHHLFERVSADADKHKGSKPRLTVIQTSSSHEPFDVPFRGPHADVRANAFQYADSCLGSYMSRLKASPRYDSTLVVIVPDHYGCYPHPLDGAAERHHIPLVMTGGAIAGISLPDSVLCATGSQTDIAATILSMLGLSHSQFAFSSNLLDPARTPFAFFSEPSWIAVKRPTGITQISVDTAEPIGAATPDAVTAAKAYTQSLYTDISAR